MRVTGSHLHPSSAFNPDYPHHPPALLHDPPQIRQLAVLDPLLHKIRIHAVEPENDQTLGIPAGRPGVRL